MAKQKKKIVIKIAFQERVEFGAPIVFEKAFSACSPDAVIVSSDGIEISYTRSSSTSKRRALNKTRVKYLQDVLFVLACTENVLISPVLSSATFELEGKESEKLELPESLQGLSCDYSGVRFNREVASRSLQGDDLAKTLRIACSYCWAASKVFSDEERLKLLWGAFNAQYRWYAHFIDSSVKQEYKMLDIVNSLFLESNVLNRTLQLFNNTFNDEKYQDFVRWKLVTSERLGAFYIKDSDKESARNAKIIRLKKLDVQTLESMRDIGCGDVQGKQSLKKAIGDVIQSAEENSPLKKVCMLLCRYTYIFRCDGVHANEEYPVFRLKSLSDKKVLGDLLEAAVIDFSSWLSSGEDQ